jgi:hypothetical protein
MALEELTQESTTEDVKTYVDQVVEEVQAERAGTEKDDARITVEHADNEHKTPVAEKKSGDDAAKPKGKGEVKDAGEEESSKAEWLDDDLKAEVAAYGIEESELADFTSREELDRALRLFDKSALEAGRKALAEEGDKATGRNAKGQFLKKEAEPKADPKAEGKPEAADGKYEPKLDKAVYDEEIVNEFTRMRDHYEARREELETRFKALEERFLESDAKAQEQQFDSAIDKLDMPKLFGTTGKETPDELKKREEVMAQARVLQAGYRTFGRDVEMGSLVSRAAPMVFSSEFDKHNLKNRTRKISKQSNGRQGGGATRPQDPRDDPRDEADRLYKELERA